MSGKSDGRGSERSSRPAKQRSGSGRRGGAGARGRGAGAAEDPRKRMIAAMLALVGEQGGPATTVADVIARAGASRKTFYEHFEDRQACLLAAGEEVSRLWLERAQGAVYEADGAGEALQALIGALLEAAIESPAGLRMLAAELTSVGRAGIERRERTLSALARLLGEALEGLANEAGEESGGGGGDGQGFRMAGGEEGSLLVRALTGAIVRMAYARMRRGERVRRARRARLVGLAPEIVRWTAQFRLVAEPQVGQDARGGRVPVGGRAPGTLSLEARASERRGLPRGESAVSHSFVVHNQRERLLDALANLSAAKGFDEVTIPEIVHEAAVSVQAFYEHFAGREDAFCVAYELGQRKLLAIVERAYESGEDWPAAMRAALGTLLDFLASEPSFARMASVDVLTAGAKADALARNGAARLGELLRPGLRYSQDGAQRETTVEGTVGALQELWYVYAAGERAREMGALLELAVHVALVPFGGLQGAELAPRAGRAAGRPPA